ncbi:MAG: hypoxanthine phosphoribosyltransferase [Chlorobi bacterium]|nr:hypoxanthine phosphoribosyltransferase [Chlorobiota bacterium]
MKHDASSVQPSNELEQRRVTLHNRTFECFIERDEIARAVEKIAAQIERDYSGRQVVLVIVLKGALLFAADLVRMLRIPLRIEFVRASSYGAAMRSSGTVELDGTLRSVQDCDVIVVEDIADSGTTLAALVAHLEQFSPRSIAVATLLSKPAVHGGRVPLDYVGIEIPPVFVVGYGLDYNELGRNLPDIYRVVDK